MFSAHRSCSGNLSKSVSCISQLSMRVFTRVQILLVSQLGEVMVSMASNLMLADERVLWMAQREAMACSRIITCLQKIAVYRLATAQAFSLVSPINNSMIYISYPRRTPVSNYSTTFSFFIESYFTLRVALPDIPQHRTGGSRCQGQ